MTVTLAPQTYVRYDVHMGKIVSATEVRKNFFKFLRLAGVPGSNITVTLQGNPPVVMMSQDEFDGWMETLEIMSDPQLVKDIKAAAKEKGGTDWEDLKKQLKL